MPAGGLGHHHCPHRQAGGHRQFRHAPRAQQAPQRLGRLAPPTHGSRQQNHAPHQQGADGAPTPAARATARSHRGVGVRPSVPREKMIRLCKGMSLLQKTTKFMKQVLLSF